MPRPVRKVGAPLAAIIACGVVIGALVLLFTALNPAGAIIGFTLSSIVMTGAVFAYLWLDRWEPEPPRLLLLAFGWGAAVAVVLSLILGLFADALLATPGVDSSHSFASVAIRAPFIEEAAKGLFLLVMMTGRRRNELNSLTDCLVYAGLVGLGFAWLEDIMYISSADTLGGSLLTAALRLIMAPFAHSLFTTMTAIGVYFALQQRSGVAKALCILVGYLGAVLMHGLWNGSSLLGTGTYFIVYIVWMVPIFITMIVVAVISRRREQRVVAAKLPGMVAAGLITHNEATWLGSLKTRHGAVQQATMAGGRPAGKAVAAFAAAVVELAFVRDRIDRGFGDAQVYALQQEEVYSVAAARSAAPILQWLANYQAPVRY
ncbi:PrsW family intramembrane metalloprotease [Mycolicibacterium fortuitum]|jgi:RsiW-degrading membrane proteinase PrsW (M82 family)|uniref:PrsW family intramembrane metalloprotease n=6 Tax=Mycolicibacterium fortuitum TaxID=1766 RepID=A0AAE5AE42_MYCFO|nr:MULTISPECIES: PrsW family intramembrane metalloprotease [Mycolicibacterium]MBP3084010.1 PrsW family intramembrane metalloprotease [Mycolicibacterium fortuitum]MCA4725167.1 PrsW family intramembrane metalloprotease [Mycolicibacterium fortuitum]MCA4752906.1 PrsW family intramembrane metalloprotease [Mycolicibacterium fortuitum]MCV7139968.1 PrsW family intramembrane metalloprotease [Mycolicibacterium fortuitum]MDG5772117.1 PrsW family intramembrane metalloprotease [Mycolicibacterium fortuitum]